ncbi:MAG: mycofactocin biosynthesis glycosyltransferase MftF [Chloroflexota bacterium]|nr:mycofactocin biosynthesis glycosyltransferase MftF [Chloroflexota bacterium]
MLARDQQPAPGTYRLASGIRVVSREDSEVVICRYPLRAIRLGPLATRLLRLCGEQRTCEELAHALELPLKRVEALCEQLRWKDLLEAGPALAPVTWPGISIIIPTYNRARQLERCLRSLHALDYPARCLEIIVVDDASTDETGALLLRLAVEFADQGSRLRVVRHTHQQGVANGRNSGAEAARYDLLAYIDSDCVASPGWLAQLVPAFQDAHVAAVGGMIRAYERQSMLGRYEDVCSSLFMGLRAQQVSAAGPLTYLPTANLLLRREAWQRLGGFAALTFGEDVDLCRRLLATGGHILYIPYGVVYHDYRTQLWPFLRIRASYASAEAMLLSRHPGERRVLLLPPERATFAGLTIGGLWSAIRARGKRRSGLLCLFMAGILLITGTYRRARQVRKQAIPIGPLTILQATLRAHLAYTYHLCRHLTRYYTLPLALAGVILPPLLLLVGILCGIVIGVDYARLRPPMRLGEYALCSLLDDCAYEVGVLLGCMRQRTWKPLLPVVRRKISTAKKAIIR